MSIAGVSKKGGIHWKLIKTKFGCTKVVWVSVQGFEGVVKTRNMNEARSRGHIRKH